MAMGGFFCLNYMIFFSKNWETSMFIFEHSYNSQIFLALQGGIQFILTICVK